jgi:hypothetical protein
MVYSEYNKYSRMSAKFHRAFLKRFPPFQSFVLRFKYSENENTLACVCSYITAGIVHSLAISFHSSLYTHDP